MMIMISYHCLEINSGREHDNDCDDAEENGERCCDDCAHFQAVAAATWRQTF